jgi:hypothetical protein
MSALVQQSPHKTPKTQMMNSSFNSSKLSANTCSPTDITAFMNDSAASLDIFEVMDDSEDNTNSEDRHQDSAYLPTGLTVTVVSGPDDEEPLQDHSSDKSRSVAACHHSMSDLERVATKKYTKSSAQKVTEEPFEDTTTKAVLLPHWKDQQKALLRARQSKNPNRPGNKLCREMESTAVYQFGAIHFARPDLENIIKNHTLNLIAARRSSCSVLIFCGSPESL